MKLEGFVITAVVVVGLSGTAFAQTGSAPVSQPVASTDNIRSWMVSGFLGTNFGSSRNSAVDLSAVGEDIASNTGTAANFGGQIAYLARGVIGGEFLADFSPSLDSFNNVLFERAPGVNSYMFNLVAVAPFGHAHSFDPYVSGGVGSVSLHSTIFTIDPTRTRDINTIATETISGSRFGWDLGFGGMAWSEKNWGFRGDVRYYRTSTNNAGDNFDINHIGDGTDFTRLELSGMSLWKANAGLAFRW